VNEILRRHLGLSPTKQVPKETDDIERDLVEADSLEASPEYTLNTTMALME
jgi:hypothetical protein